MGAARMRPRHIFRHSPHTLRGPREAPPKVPVAHPFRGPIGAPPNVPVAQPPCVQPPMSAHPRHVSWPHTELHRTFP
eukprot:9472430-Pyramimonas_sp.AAC.1